MMILSNFSKKFRKTVSLVANDEDLYFSTVHISETRLFLAEVVQGMEFDL